MASQKRLARLAVLLSRAALGLPPAAQAASHGQSLGGLPQDDSNTPIAAADVADRQSLTEDKGRGQTPSGDILRGLAQRSLHGDAHAEQALAEALIMDGSFAEDGCALRRCFRHLPCLCTPRSCGCGRQLSEVHVLQHMLTV